MDMSVQVKYLRVASRLSRQIRDGKLPKGSQLPGEHQLAEDFAVSRGTVRQALAALERDGLIAKHAGAGSFVVYDGELIDENAGWSHALRNRGVTVRPTVLRLERDELPELARELEVNQSAFLAIDRVRCMDDGTPLSLERSRIPWDPAVAEVIEEGLENGSVSTLLARLNRAATSGEEHAEVVRLNSTDAKLLHGEPGDVFLRVVKTTRDERGSVIEHVISLLDPEHFTLSLRFGPTT